jgi:putative endonuclease
MSDKKKKGKLAEDLAVNYLQSCGYTILERNWRFSRAEIDIIAMDGKVLVITEVKSRSYTGFGHPEESISKYKENLIIDAAGRYMEKIQHDWEVRFDIISIVFDKMDGYEIKHYKDAFFPGF